MGLSFYILIDREGGLGGGIKGVMIAQMLTVITVERYVSSRSPVL